MIGRSQFSKKRRVCCLVGSLCLVSSVGAQDAPPADGQSDSLPPPSAELLAEESLEIPAGDEESILKLAPESIEDLVAVQQRVSKLLEHSMAATVGILTNGSGSGVIISEDGYVLTAGHVSGKPDEDVLVVMPDGRHLRAKSLGNIVFADAGLIKISEDGPFPFVEMGDPGSANPGDWCYVLGHPGGIDELRGMVLRIGRVIRRQSRTIQTDCRLVGGDSGGPLFNMNGEVIGINSRIKPELDGNFHVAIRMFKRYWEEMREGRLKTSSRTYVAKKGGYLGVQTALHARGVLITRVLKDSPAQRNGIRPGDIVISVDGKKLQSTTDFSRAIGEHGVGETVSLTFLRRGMEGETEIELGDLPSGES